MEIQIGYTGVMQQFVTIFEYVGRGIEYVGVVIVAAAALVALARLLQRSRALTLVRKQFAEWIMTGLEFIIAAEIIFATLITHREELLLLGAVVIIRILLGYALRKEIV